MAKLRDPSQQGFTLVELVVVIAILGVLAATATPMVSNFLGKSKEQAYNADRATVQSAIDAFYSSPINPRGRVASMYVHFPRRKGAPGIADNRGFISAVYP